MFLLSFKIPPRGYHNGLRGGLPKTLATAFELAITNAHFDIVDALVKLLTYPTIGVRVRFSLLSTGVKKK